VAEDGESCALAAAVIELAAVLKLKTVAEGIESAGQLQRLRELRCDLGQGYFFARPLPPDELETMLSERHLREAEFQALGGLAR
jgi:EAL domain-containing protein (putative c-di-GMP-specific phosphodiesterase class I)